MCGRCVWPRGSRLWQPGARRRSFAAAMGDGQRSLSCWSHSPSVGTDGLGAGEECGPPWFRLQALKLPTLLKPGIPPRRHRSTVGELVQEGQSLSVFPGQRSRLGGAPGHPGSMLAQYLKRALEELRLGVPLCRGEVVGVLSHRAIGILYVVADEP